MAMSLTESLKHNRYSVVAVDAAAGRLRVRSEAELCTDFACGEAAVVTDEGRSHALADINPGDIVTLEHQRDPRGAPGLRRVLQPRVVSRL